MERFCQRCRCQDIHHYRTWDRRLTCYATSTSPVFLRAHQPPETHPHHCPDCFEHWPCADADCEPEEAERLCTHCRQAYLR